SQIGWDGGLHNFRVALGSGITGTAAQQRRPIYVADVSKDDRYIPSAAKTCSEFAIPLIVRDVVVGVLDCQSDTLNFFDSDTIALLTLFSTQASIAIHNAH